MTDISWGTGDFTLRISASEDAPAMLSIAHGVDAAEPVKDRHRARPAAVEALVLGEGRALNNTRAIRTAVGDRMRLVGTAESEADGVRRLEIVQRDAVTGLEATLRLEQFDGVSAYRATTTIRNGGAARVVLQQVTSASLIGLTGHLGDPHDLDLWTARSEWCAESRWASAPLGGRGGLVDIDTPIHGHFARGSVALSGHSTWSSGEFVPTAVLENRSTGRALAWQIENNGPWRWEIDTLFDPAEWLALELLGPTDLDHAWTRALEPGESFETVPVSFALADGGLQGAIAELTAHRRRSHLPVVADAERPLVFNDYMNALMGDPTTERLLPLVDAAAAAGARYFCIDAGWYDDGGDWWPSVGAWEPSTVRFGELGLAGMLEHIREKGMTPGLWVEPEVIGVLSPVASRLPEEAFMHRSGVRIVEHDRYFLDFRSAAAREYLDGVFRRLIEEYGAHYFKWDYNVTPGSGPDSDASGPGEGLLDHARAHHVDAARQPYQQARRAQFLDVAVGGRGGEAEVAGQVVHRPGVPVVRVGIEQHQHAAQAGCAFRHAGACSTPMRRAMSARHSWRLRKPGRARACRSAQAMSSAGGSSMGMGTRMGCDTYQGVSMYSSSRLPSGSRQYSDSALPCVTGASSATPAPTRRRW